MLTVRKRALVGFLLAGGMVVGWAAQASAETTGIMKLSGYIVTSGESG